MIDREAAGRSRFLKSGTGSKGNYEEPGIITNKAIVYMVIVVLIGILCVVYVFQLKKGRSGGQEPVTAESSVTAQTGEVPAPEGAAADQAAGEAAGEAAAGEAAADQAAGEAAEAPAEPAEGAAAEDAATPAE